MTTNRPGVPAQTRLDVARPEERVYLEAALLHTCSACGVGPGEWCYRGGATGLWTVHPERIQMWSNTAEPVQPVEDL